MARYRRVYANTMGNSLYFHARKLLFPFFFFLNVVKHANPIPDDFTILFCEMFYKCETAESYIVLLL